MNIITDNKYRELKSGISYFNKNIQFDISSNLKVNIEITDEKIDGNFREEFSEDNTLRKIYINSSSIGNMYLKNDNFALDKNKNMGFLFIFKIAELEPFKVKLIYNFYIEI
ncbi:hypothetical protein [Fusobacterium mortiferum]|uniref:Uncharacterized protein n=1 Tax=Fusobacterium mortiferum ATCC 9817 TaxID=469616 RepID=A0ABM6TXQ8_FUSMR|nr:hypothetical protein [Fusobacterium mortiferum]AVQ19207.1 hypothetical protein C4N19_08910 [Fusobacterium mortiferum ATCC 9817]EEO36396.1 hypothetical protein FMAG_01958 [Fusobacterium mortiferum ATCC 9817]